MQPNDRPDALALAESVAAGRLTLSRAEDQLRQAFADDPLRAEREILELGELALALGAVRRHAAAFRTAVGGRSVGGLTTPGPAPAPTTTGATAPGASLTGERARPERVDRAPVRVRPAPPPRPAGRTPRFAFVAVAAAVALIAGAGLVASLRPAVVPAGASPTPGLGGSPVPTSPVPSGSASPTPEPSVLETPYPTSAVEGIPAIMTQTLPGAPRVALWAPSGGVFVNVWTWRSGGSLDLLCSLDTWPDTQSADSQIQRTVSISPDGSHVAFAEWALGQNAKYRFRIFDTSGSVVWTAPDEPPDYVPFVWSADGHELALGSAPGPWLLVTIDASGSVQSRTLRLTGIQNAFGLIGFSRDGSLLYGYNTEGEAEFYEKPEALDLATRRLSPVDQFPTGPTGPAQSNGTTRVDTIDNGTGLVLAQGGLARGEPYWMVRSGSEETQLPVSAPTTDMAWTQNGRLAVSATLGERPQRSISLHEAAFDPGSGSLSPAGPDFTIGAGDYDAAFIGNRGEYALYLISSVASGTEIERLGFDEAVLVHLPEATSSVIFAGGRSGSGGDGFHFAGWLP